MQSAVTTCDLLQFIEKSAQCHWFSEHFTCYILCLYAASTYSWAVFYVSVAMIFMHLNCSNVSWLRWTYFCCVHAFQFCPLTLSNVMYVLIISIAMLHAALVVLHKQFTILRCLCLIFADYLYMLQ